MSILDKAKTFLGGHGVTVRHVALEPAALALGDSLVAGRFAVAAEKPCVLLSVTAEVVLEIAFPEGRVEQVAVGRVAFPEAGVEREGALLQYPHQLSEGAEVEDVFQIVMDGSVEALLAQHPVSVGGDARLIVRTEVDVEGSPFDPECATTLAIAR